jgi:hypothetical protein
MSTLFSIPNRHDEKRKVFILRLWARGKDESVWVCEIQDVSTGETVHAQNLQALFDWLKQKTSQVAEPSAKK